MLRWWIAGLLFLSTVINYIDRQALSAVAPVITRELSLSPIEYSNILTAFLAAYTVMYVGSGFLVDRLGTRVSLALFMAWWSIANMLHAFAQGVWSLGLFRFLLGMGESGNYMAAFKAVSEWYPAKERAFVNGLIQAGGTVGAAIAIPTVAVINENYGWRPAFIATGALGLIWLAAWLYFYYPPSEHPRISAAEQAIVPAPVSAATEKAPWTALLGYPQTWGLLLSRFLSDPVWWFYLFWLPKYMVENRGFTMLEMAALTWLPYVTADAGALLGGWISGQLVARGWETLKARRITMLPFALLMPLSLLVNHVSAKWALVLIGVITFAHMGWKSNQATLTNDIYPRHLVGTASGMLAFGNGLGGTLFTWSTGYIVQWFGYETIFVIMSVLHPISYLMVARLVRQPLKGA
ncbi:MAG: MFS transporter [Acidobacteria bacterium]|nr:MFS transporter [Acidobacteriota bacterium]